LIGVGGGGAVRGTIKVAASGGKGDADALERIGITGGIVGATAGMVAFGGGANGFEGRIAGDAPRGFMVAAESSMVRPQSGHWMRRASAEGTATRLPHWHWTLLANILSGLPCWSDSDGGL